METERICPSCGRPLAAGAPQGLCPECLMKAGFGTGVAPEPGESTHQPAFTPPTLAEMAMLFPQLEIVELLGRGGMGAVYKARQPAIDRWVALKVLPPQSTARPGFTERFNREARALARLNHPNIVALYEFGQVGGMPYFVMEYVEGVTLRRLGQARRLEPREALKIVPQICEALQFAHDEGVVHRDIKPENILIDKKGRVKIADFGIAKIMGGTPLTPSLSPSDGERVSGRTGEGPLTQDQVLGTPNYMAPEQVEHPQAVDHRADIYSLGVVFYEMLTGELPLGRFAPPSKKVQMDVRLDEVVLHALEKEPELRYQQASQVKTAVETIALTNLRRGKVPLPTPPPADQSKGEAAQRQVKIPAIGLLVLSGLTLCVLAVVLPIWFLGAWLSVAGKASVPWVLVIPMLLLMTGCNILSLIGAWRMRQLRSHTLAVVGSILFILSPWIGIQAGTICGVPSPTWSSMSGILLGLVFGIWSLIVLSRREVHEAFGKAPPLPAEAPSPSPTSTDQSQVEAAGRAVRKAFQRVGWRLLLVFVVQIGLLETLVRASLHWKESTGELWTMALLVGSFVAVVWAFWPGFRLRGWRLLSAGGTVVACFVLLTLDNLYNWHLRPNLGVYQEADWVAQHPGFQKELQQRIQKNLWRKPAAAPPTTGNRKPEGAHRKFVRVVVDKDAMTFEGRPTNWEEVGALLEKVVDRTNTVLECAVTSDQITVQQQNEWSMKCVTLAQPLGFEYVSFIGIHPLGSKGTPSPNQR